MVVERSVARSFVQEVYGYTQAELTKRASELTGSGAAA